MLVWQGDTPIAAEPLSWVSPCLTSCCLCRATRGEARGHRSGLAQNSLLMYPSFFLPLDWSSVCCVLALWWTGPHCLCAAVAAFLPGFVRSRFLMDMWVAEGHTARLRGCVCGNRGRRAHHGYPRGLARVGWMGRGAIRWHSFVYLCRCGDRSVRPEGWYSMATHPQ